MNELTDQEREAFQQQEIAPPRKPISGYPVWFHDHGWKIRPREQDEPHTLVLAGSAAQLTISPAGSSGWKLSWEVTHMYGSDEDHGQRIFTNHQLKAAFDLASIEAGWESLSSYWLVERYGATCASQANFIRWRRFLNIPGPGTGHDGTSEISIEVTDEIKTAIQQLIERRNNGDALL